MHWRSRQFGRADIAELLTSSEHNRHLPSVGDSEAHFVSPKTVVDKDARRWFDHKSRLMESVLGKEYPLHMQAIFPYTMGGGLASITTRMVSRVPQSPRRNYPKPRIRVPRTRYTDRMSW